MLLSATKVLIFSEDVEKNREHRRASPVFRSPRSSDMTLCRFAPAFRLRHLDSRLERPHALRPHDSAAEGQTRPDVRARVRSIVIRTRARNATTRIRVAAAAIDHTGLCAACPVFIRVIGR